MESESSPIELDKVGLRKHFLTLTDSQKRFVYHVVKWCKKPQKTLLVVSGGPGTGKTFVVKKTLDYIKTEQLRMSYTARSAVNIGGKTIHSTLDLNYKGLVRDLKNKLANEHNLAESIKASREVLGEFTYHKYPYIIVIDEVSMVSGWLMYWILRYFMDRTTQPVLFITLGDRHQLNPVECSHNLFSFRFGSDNPWAIRLVELKESKRFVPEYEKIINILREFVDKEDESGMFGFICQHFPVVDDINGEILALANRAMSSTNKWVNVFNNYYIKNMVKGVEIEVNDNVILKPGCIVLVTKNGCSPASNGCELIFIQKKNDRIICADPKSKQEVEIWKDGESQLFPIALGFAATVHKFQGETLDEAKIVIHLSGNRDLNLAYTALSRVRHIDQILALAL